MIRNKYSVRKYLASTAIVTAVVFSSMLGSEASAYGGPTAEEKNNHNTQVTEEKQTDKTKTKETNSKETTNKTSNKVASNNLAKGDRGEDVKTVQDKVDVAVDGIFGKNTDNAVKDFQKNNDLAADGIVGPKTSEKLSGTNEQESTETNDSSSKQENSSEQSNGNLEKGDRGDAVKAAQTTLGISADGIFGSSTEAAVKDVQAANGLAVDGIVGPATQTALESGNVKPEEVSNNTTTQQEPTQTSTSNNSDVVSVANGLVGSDYVPAGTTPEGFDSSGFINYAFNQVGVSLSRTHAGMWANNGTHVDSPSVGDVVFFEGTYKEGVSHSGIYLGNNQMVHAGTSETGVEVTSMGYDYWQSRYIGAKSF